MKREKRQNGMRVDSQTKQNVDCKENVRRVRIRTKHIKRKQNKRNVDYETNRENRRERRMLEKRWCLFTSKEPCKSRVCMKTNEIEIDMI